MQTLLIYVFALLLVGGLLFLAASFAFGRDEQMAPALPAGTPVELPDDRLATGADLQVLRLSVVLRGYRMEEVDWLLDRLAEQVDSRDREIARLRSVLHVEPVVGVEPVTSGGSGAPADGPDPDPDAAEPELLTHQRAAGATAAAHACDADSERLSGPDGPVPARVSGDGPGPGAARSREQRLGGPSTPVRGLRPDGVPDRDQR